jgi:hypothetical protein
VVTDMPNPDSDNPFEIHSRRMAEKIGLPRCEAIPEQGVDGSAADRWQCWYRAGHAGRHMAQRAIGILYFTKTQNTPPQP